VPDGELHRRGAAEMWHPTAALVVSRPRGGRRWAASAWPSVLAQWAAQWPSSLRPWDINAWVPQPVIDTWAPVSGAFAQVLAAERLVASKFWLS
jgi:hypothetical protein